MLRLFRARSLLRMISKLQIVASGLAVRVPRGYPVSATSQLDPDAAAQVHAGFRPARWRKTVRSGTIALAAAAPFSAVAKNTGNDLLAICLSESAVCQGYIIGVYEVLSTKSVIASHRICTSANITAGEVMRVTIEFLKRHPELMNLTAESLVSQALIESYPCTPSELKLNTSSNRKNRHSRLHRATHGKLTPVPARTMFARDQSMIVGGIRTTTREDGRSIVDEGESRWRGT